jgi:chromosome partitioning protein
MAATHAAHVIVLGNEKGGSGKSTIALHLAIGLLQLGFRVAVADFDERQQSLLRYLDNRQAAAAAGAAALTCPTIYRPPAPTGDVDAGASRLRQIEAELGALACETDFLIIDTPGTATALSDRAHGFADTLVTPMNDSLIDLDVLARVDPRSLSVVAPSHYSRNVLAARRRRLTEHGAGIDWIVLRNRVAALASANNERVGRVLDVLAPKLGFRLAPGFSERVVFRELFLAGTTVLDKPGTAGGPRSNMSHIAARLELRRLFDALWLPQVEWR